MTVVRDRKFRTARRTNQIVGFVTVLAWKKPSLSRALERRSFLFVIYGTRVVLFRRIYHFLKLTQNQNQHNHISSKERILIEPNPKPITRKKKQIIESTNQSSNPKPVAGAKRGKKYATESQLIWMLFLIG